MLLLLLLALLTCSSALEVQLGALGTGSEDLVVTLLLKAEAERLKDRETTEKWREVAEQRYEVAEQRHKSQMAFNGDILDAVATAATSERVYACAKAGAVLLITQKWAGSNNSYLCSATPLFTAQPQAESTHFLTSAHCFTDISRDGAAFASSSILHYPALRFNCSLVRHFFCRPSTTSNCSQTSIDLAIIRCSEPVPAPSTHLSVLPQQNFQRVFFYGFSDGYHLDPDLMYTLTGTSRRSALHVKFARLAPSIQYPQPLKLTDATLGAGYHHLLPRYSQ